MEPPHYKRFTLLQASYFQQCSVPVISSISNYVTHSVWKSGGCASGQTVDHNAVCQVDCDTDHSTLEGNLGEATCSDGTVTFTGTVVVCRAKCTLPDLTSFPGVQWDPSPSVGAGCPAGQKVVHGTACKTKCDSASGYTQEGSHPGETQTCQDGSWTSTGSAWVRNPADSPNRCRLQCTVKAITSMPTSTGVVWKSGGCSSGGVVAHDTVCETQCDATIDYTAGTAGSAKCNNGNIDAWETNPVCHAPCTTTAANVFVNALVRAEWKGNSACASASASRVVHNIQCEAVCKSGYTGSSGTATCNASNWGSWICGEWGQVNHSENGIQQEHRMQTG